MKKSKVILFIIIGLIVILSIIGTVIHINNKRNFKSDNTEQYMATIVMKGFQLRIPDKYMATYDESIGLMYWNNEHFDMLIDVEIGDYNKDIVDELESINAMMKLDLVVVIPYNEITIDGKSYTYMLYYDEGIPTLHSYTIADDGKMYEIMVLCNEMAMIKPQSEQEIRTECEELMWIAHSIIKTSKATDEDDSPSGEVFVGKESYESLYSEVQLNFSDIYIENDYVQGISTKTKAKYSVKENFYCTGSKSKDDIYYLKIYSDYNDNLITVYIEEKDNLYYDLYSIVTEGSIKWTRDSTVYDYNINDFTVYYYTYLVEYIEDNEKVIECNYVSMVDLGEGYVFVVEGKGTSEDIKNPEYYKDFYNVNLEKTQ